MPAEARAPSGSSFSDVIGPRGWFMSAPVGGRPNIMPPAPRGTDDGYSFRPHSSSSVGQGEAELKPGTVSSERSFKPLSYTVDHTISPVLVGVGASRYPCRGGLLLF
uniref:Uncharacterized protein n=1 Tax=Anopheles dirus TaxID=7168 RepID=A0A182MXY5_9DIPT